MGMAFLNHDDDDDDRREILTIFSKKMVCLSKLDRIEIEDIE